MLTTAKGRGTLTSEFELPTTDSEFFGSPRDEDRNYYNDTRYVILPYY
jgi:hypothetical protein